MVWSQGGRGFRTTGDFFRFVRSVSMWSGIFGYNKTGPLSEAPLSTGDEARIYRLRLTNSFNISSAVVMTRAFAWNPRCATIILVNSSERSTLEPSMAPGVILD